MPTVEAIPCSSRGGPVAYWAAVGEARGVVVVGPVEPRQAGWAGVGARVNLACRKHQVDLRRVFVDLRASEMRRSWKGTQFAGFVIRGGVKPRQRISLYEEFAGRPVCSVGSSAALVKALKRDYAEHADKLLVLDEMDGDRVGDFLLQHEYPVQARSGTYVDRGYGVRSLGPIVVEPRRGRREVKLTYACKPDNVVDIEVEGAISVTVQLNDDLVDLNRPVTIRINGKTAWEKRIARNWALARRSLTSTPRPHLVLARVALAVPRR